MANTSKKSSAAKTNVDKTKSFAQRFNEYRNRLFATVSEYTSITQVKSNDELEVYVNLHSDAWMQLRLDNRQGTEEG